MTVDIEKLEALAKAWRIHVAQQEMSDDILNLIADFKSTAHDHDLLRDECDALRKDAERYRWFRDNSLQIVHASPHCFVHRLDKAIDEAMSREAACTHSAN